MGYQKDAMKQQTSNPPKKFQWIAARVLSTEADTIDEAAKACNTSKSNFIRDAVREKIKGLSANTGKPSQPAPA
jgi:uncharacterized protein (DUF1778 family)